jgi:HK97 family phage prohead protease
MNYEVKDFNNAVDFKDAPFDVDDKSRRVKVALNKVGIKDHDNDIIEKGAFDKTIKERGPKGKNLIWHLTDHWASLKNAVGKFSDLFMDGDYLVGITDIPPTTWGNDVLEFYKSGAINQHSIGFRTIKREISDEGSDDQYCLLKEIFLYEGSAVLWGANENTPTFSVGKSKSLDGMINCPKCKTPTKDIESGMGYVKCSNCNQPITQGDLIADDYAKTLDELGKLNKMFKSGHLSDQSYELIEIKVSQLTTRLQQLFEEATQPAVKAVEPENDSLMNVYENIFNNTFKRQDNDGRGKSSKAA